MVNTAKRVKFRLFLSIALLAFAFYVGLIGLWEWSENRDPTLEEAFPTGLMRVGIDATYPPFAVDDGQSIVGIDIDLANELATRMQLDVHFVTMGFDGLYDALIDGQVDVVISALLVNPARTREVIYTQSYFDNGLLLVTDTRNQSTITNLPSQSLALEYGSIAHSQANTWLQTLDPFSIRPYELPQYALDAVRLEAADNALVDTTTYLLYQSQNPDWVSSATNITTAPYAIAIRSDRLETWVWVNTVLGNIKQDGTLDSIINNWFAMQ
ncbi:MAG: ABC transporter substrate-binding protein [Phototrophicaceae bacterium]